MTDSAAVPSPVIAGDAPLFAVLERFDECEAILNGNSVGRIAFALQDRVSIVPVHYVYDSGWIYGRTAAGGKLREILRNRRVAFEVDEHTHLFEWRSVVVRGPLYLIEPDTTDPGRRIYTKAVSLIRRLVPSTLTDSDPVPFRDQLFRIRVAEISGRTSEPAGGVRRLPEVEKPTPEVADAESDAFLSRQVENALAEVTLSPGSKVRVDAFDGVIVLTGVVEDSAERNAVEDAVVSLPEVQAIAQQLETVFPSRQQPTAVDIAREAVRQMHNAPSIADPRIKVVVEHGWLRLEGLASSQSTRDDLARRLRDIRGSRGVIDRLGVTQPAKVGTD